MDILSLFVCFETFGLTVQVRQLAIISQAILTMTGRVTMRGVSRWTDKGGSYRTINRFFATRLPWAEMLTQFFRVHLFNEKHEYIVGGDATTITKAGDQTHGIEHFFSGVLGKVVKGLEFFVISLIDVTSRKSYPLAVKQTCRSRAEKEAAAARKKQRQAAKKSKKSRKKREPKLKGRPLGVKNKDREKFDPSPELLRISELLKLTLKLVRVFVKVKYLALDGHFGHQQAVLMARESKLELISKLRRDSVLLEKYEGEYSGRGRRKKYGGRLDYENLPKKYLKKSERVGEIITRYYQGIFLSKNFSSELNVVVIEKTNVKTGKVGRAILFSSDAELGWEKLIDYYSLRFQIEFNFRDAKQHFGLEDFMQTTETGVENAANLSFLMVNLSAKLLKDSGENCIGINDLKSQYRGVKYAIETIKMVQPKAEIVLIEKVKAAIGRIGSIHRHNISTSSA
jgi:putative transposase